MSSVFLHLLLLSPYTYDRLEGELGFEPPDDGPTIGDVLGFNEAVSDSLPGFIEAHDGGFIISGGTRARRGRVEGQLKTS